jgi:hypothetical protein
MYNTLRRQFENTDIFKKIKVKYPRCYSEFFDFLLESDGSVANEDSKKAHRQNFHEQGVFFTSSFFYLQLLFDKNPLLIADVGCGLNFFREYYPNIIGYDSTEYADYHERFDDNFVVDHYKEFDAAFAINSLHFIPIHKFSSRINDFCKILKLQGRGYITFNARVMLENTDDTTKKSIFSTLSPTTEQVSNYFDSQIDKVNNNIIYYHNRLKSAESINNSITKLNKHSYNNVKGEDWPEYQDYILDNYTECNLDIQQEITCVTENNIRKLTNNELLDDSINGTIRLVIESI